jgi:hypothetical protein
MMKQPVKIRLEIVPEKQSALDNALAQEVGDEIFAYLQAQGYYIEPDYTGKMGGGVFGLFVAQFMENAGQALMVVVAESVIEKLLDAIKQLFTREAPEERKEPHSLIAINLPDGQQINVQGTLSSALKEGSIILKQQKKRVVRAGQDTETTESIAITIKISASSGHNHS